jgi:hypothetical protein
MRTPLSIATLVLALAIPASAGAWADDGHVLLPPTYGGFFGPGAGPAPTYDGLGPFPSAVFKVGEGADSLGRSATPQDTGRMTLVGRGRRTRIELECPPGQISRVPDDALVPRCFPASAS